MTVSRYLTRMYAKLLHGGVVDEKLVSVAGVERYVFYVESDGWSLAGQGLPAFNIVLNREPLHDYSENVHDYVFLHEAGHKQWPFPIQLLFGAAQMLLLLFSLMAPFILIMALSTVPWEAAPLTIIGWTSGFLFILLIIIGFPMLITWIDEGSAEIHAIRKIGPEQVAASREEIRRNRDDSRIKQIRRFLFYPPFKWTMAIGRRLHSE